MTPSDLRRRGGVAMSRAIDLVGGHSWACVDHGHGSCICDYAERQQAARDIDARVAALVEALREARPWVRAALAHAVLPGADMDGARLLARIDAMLAPEVDRG